MPRTARLDAPGILHHIIIRGIERRKIFRDNQDHENLLARLAKLLPETNTACYAWAFLPNHAHFLLRSGDVGLSTLMRRLLTGYAVSFNLKYKRHGPLFQGRYKSIICQEDRYLKELVRYIHLNPFRAKRVSDISKLNQYAYCGHSALLDRKKREWQDTDYVLSFYGTKKAESQKCYLEHVKAAIDQGRREDLIGGGLIRSLGGWSELKKHQLKGNTRIKGDERILGDSNFVQEILSLAEEQLNRKYELKSKGYDLKAVEKKVSTLYQIKPAQIYARGNQKLRVQARSLFCYWAARELGMAITELAKRLELTPSAVGYAVSRGEIIAKEKNYCLLD
ncbi:MAG: transposase [Desulfobacterales bacterium]|jgi:REP element-mobilizing transposase RayT